MWEMYEELIAGIPEGLHIKRSVAGSFWTVVESELGVGAAGTAKTMTRPPLQKTLDCFSGSVMVPRDVYLRSWLFTRATSSSGLKGLVM